MQEETGEIRKVEEIPEDRRGWSKSFHVGEIVEFKGIKVKILKIKQLRGQIVLGCYKE